MAQCLNQPRQLVLVVAANHGVYDGPDAASPHTICYASFSRLCDGSRLPFFGNSRQSTAFPFGISSLDVRSRMSCLYCQLSVRKAYTTVNEDAVMGWPTHSLRAWCANGILSRGRVRHADRIW